MKLPLLLIFALFSLTCSGRTPINAVPDRLTPPEDVVVVVELDASDWSQICFRLAPAQPQKYRCLYIKDLRQQVQPTLRAN